MTHKTKGIVLKSIHYGDTSIIVSIFTELFGIQKYIVKGIRKSGKTTANKISFFQPAAILDLEVYKNDLKNLQFIKEYSWHYRYHNLYFDVIKNAIATYIIELFQNTIGESEENPELYYFLENYLINTDKTDNNYLANVPLYFTLGILNNIGFQIHGEFTSTNSLLDLQEGKFVSILPNHPFYLENEKAKITSELLHNPENTFSGTPVMNRKTRRDLLNSYEIYFTLHIENFNKLKSLPILQTVL